MGLKSGNVMGIFSQKNLVWRTFSSRSNPGVLLGFLKDEKAIGSRYGLIFVGQRVHMEISKPGLEFIDITFYENISDRFAPQKDIAGYLLPRESIFLF
jgi:hypothetical protein